MKSSSDNQQNYNPENFSRWAEELLRLLTEHAAKKNSPQSSTN